MSHSNLSLAGSPKVHRAFRGAAWCMCLKVGHSYFELVKLVVSLLSLVSGKVRVCIW